MSLTLDGTTGISATGNIYGNNIIVSNSLTAGSFAPSSLSSAGNVTGGNILTAGIISASGNITGNYILGNGSQLTGVDATQIVNGTSNARVVSSGGNIAVGIGGTSNVTVFATTGAFVTGAMSATGNVTGGNILTGGLISATGAITGAALTGTSLTVTTGNITGGNLLLSGAIIDSAQLDIQTSASNANIALAPNGTGLVTVTTQVSAVGNVTGGNILTAGLISATSTITSTANVVGGNVTTGGIVTATGNIQGGNIRTAGLISATGAITSASNLSLTGNIVDGGELWINTSANGNINLNVNGTGQTNIPTGILSVTGNIQGGNLRTAGLISATGAITGAALTGTSLTVSTGNLTCGNIVNANGNGVGNIGSASLYFNTVFAKATSAQYADLAEMYAAGSQYEPGTVVTFGGAYEIEISTSSHANNVAGVVSTNPSYLMNAAQEGPHVVAVALQGRVPTRVIGSISKGDRMVSSDLPGIAQALDPAKYEPGCIIGKALQAHEPSLDENGIEIPGTIEVVVGRI